MLLSDLLTPHHIRVPLTASGKDALLEELVGMLAASGVVDGSAEVLGAVREREAVLSTGIGNGVAIPHGKSERVGALVMAAGVTSAPVDFEALDGEPVSLFFLLVGPEATAGEHVKALSRISRLLRRDSLRDALLHAPDSAAFHAALVEAEAA